MLKTAYGFSGCVTAPHRLAAKAGVDILEAGGTAIEAMVAAAATIAIVYPHMNSIGGDGFWLIKRKGEAPIAIEACGQAARLASLQWYGERGYEAALPARGAHAALTVPGTIGGWEKALSYVSSERRLPLADLLSDAILYAKNGIAVTKNQADCTAEKISGLKDVAGFKDVYLQDGAAPNTASRMVQASLGNTLNHLVEYGLSSFYNGEIVEAHDAFLSEHDSPLRAIDFKDYASRDVTPLTLKTSLGTFFNMPPPTQGMSSLMILGVFDRLRAKQGESFEHLHGLIEATKQAFLIRNEQLGDPASMPVPAQELLSSDRLNAMAEGVDMARALPWPHVAKEGDTVWMGACDKDGTQVSFIQSIFWEFGSGMTCPQTGVVFQNRGAGFSLTDGANQLAPGKRPFHTLNPAMAVLNDGRIMTYGTMGGEGQPQTQAALLTRYAAYGIDLQEAITMPRWLLGKTWGDDSATLKIESNMDPALVSALRDAGHDVQIVPQFSDIMGHAGAIVLHENGLIEGANDPRSDGLALSF